MTAAQYAPAVLQAGVDSGTTPKGIVIGFATVFVESNWTMYANPAVPESESIPHDADGTDSLSVGLFQQQVRDDGNGWWWGDAATCMDPYKSAALFFGRLATHPYNSDDQTPGGYAQDVQDSAYPDRYDERMADAQALYDSLTGNGAAVPAADPQTAALNRLATVRPDFNEYPKWVSKNFQSRNNTKIDLWLLHTEEASGTDNADGLADFLESTTDTGSPVSYHYTGSLGYPNDDGVTIVDVVDTDDASWSVGNSNNRSINFCFANSHASWTRDQWNLIEGRTIDVAAYLFIQDAIKYGLPPIVLVPYAGGSGSADHRYCTDFLQDGNDHQDVGGPLQAPWTGFPWDLYLASVNKYALAAGLNHDGTLSDPSTTPTTPVPPVVVSAPPTGTDFATWLASASDHELLVYVVSQLGPGDPTWTSTDETQDTLRDFLWSHLATVAAKKKAKATNGT